MVVDKPYHDQVLDEHKRVRTFSTSDNLSDLVWHRDHHDRTVKVLEGDGWQFQFDNQLPFDLAAGTVLQIPAGVYHRLLAGHSQLTIEIVEQLSTDLD